MTDVVLTGDGTGDDVVDPSPDDVERAVDRLDGDRRTLVSLRRASTEVVVAGSAETGLVVYADLADGDFRSLRSTRTTSRKEVVVVAGGQPGGYEARFVTSRDAAVEAMLHFLRTGTLVDDGRWEAS